MSKFNIKFNKKPIPDYVRVKAVKYTALPELQNSFTSKTSGVGMVDNGTRILGKKITVEFAIIKDHRSILQLTQHFAGWLMGNNFNLCPLEITDGETVTYQAKVNNGVEISDALTVGEGAIEFMVPTGVAQGSDTPVSVDGNTITIFYTGTAITYPTITLDVESPCGVVKVTDPSNGRHVTVYGEFKAGDTVQIDCQGKRVRINGYINMKGVSLDSNWIAYPTAGSYTINCLGLGIWSCRVPLRYY